MKTRLLIMTMAAICSLLTAQTPSWSWAQTNKSYGYDQGGAVSSCVDYKGNEYLTGGFNDSITFGGITLKSYNFSGRDIFIVKYNSSGNVLWAKSINGDGGFDYANGIAADATGSIYVIGSFDSDSINFGTSTLINYNSGIIGMNNMFFAKFDPLGNCLGAISAGSPLGQAVGNSINIDLNSNICITGNFMDTLYIGNQALINTDHPSNGTAITNDIFIAKYSPNGTLLWATGAGGSKDDYGQSISSDSKGNLFITGYFMSPTLAFGGGINLSNSGVANSFIAKYDSSGNPIWAKSIGGSGNDRSSAIITDHSGNSAITGSFGSFSIIIGTYTLTNTGSSDVFTAKYNSSGSVLWAEKGVQGSIYDAGSGNGICSDTLGNVIVTGTCTGPLSFGGTNLTIGGVFVVKYNSLGNAIWTKWAGDSTKTYSDKGYSVSTDFNGNVYVSGNNQGTINFDNIALTNGGGIFLGKLCQITTPTISANGKKLLSSSTTGNQWYLNGTMISGATSQNYSVTQNGNYTVMTTNINGCSATSVPYNFNSTGVNGVSGGNMQVSIYPNPTTGQFTLETSSTEKQVMNIYDINGKLVLTQTIFGKTTIDTNGLDNGIYNLCLRSDSGIAYKKLIVVK